MNVPEISVKGIQSSVLAWIALILSYASVLIFIISFATPGWLALYPSTGQTVLYGLWQSCEYGSTDNPRTFCVYYTRVAGPKPDWLPAAQAMACFALIGSILLAVASTCYIFIARLSKDTRVVLILAVSAGVNVLLITTTAAVHGGGFMDTLPAKAGTKGFSYSFALAIVSALFNASAAMLYVLELRHTSNLIPA